jgi:hypothetical protein
MSQQDSAPVRFQVEDLFSDSAGSDHKFRYFESAETAGAGFDSDADGFESPDDDPESELASLDAFFSEPDSEDLLSPDFESPDFASSAFGSPGLGAFPFPFA